MTDDVLADAALFHMDAPPPVSLADKFGVPPMSVLDRRGGDWQSRKRKWLELGIRSEIGRSGGLIYAPPTAGADSVSAKLFAFAGGTSIFDPVLCELVYRWYAREGGRVLDPFAGGSVRGVTASLLRRRYLGVDLRPEQVTANREQARLGSADMPPAWIQGDSTELAAAVGDLRPVDLVFSCPPYGDLEVYSDDPRDLSTMPPAEFDELHADVIRQACEQLAPDRYAAWVISDVRDRHGYYRGMVVDTIAAFRAAGLRLLNDFVILDQVGTGAIRAERSFVATRKAVRLHQHLLVFVKGDIKRAAQYVTAP